MSCLGMNSHHLFSILRAAISLYIQHGSLEKEASPIKAEISIGLWVET